MKRYVIGDLCEVVKGQVPIMKAVEGEYPLITTAEERKTHNDWQFDCKAVCVPLVSSTGHGHASIKRIHYQQGKFALGNILAAIFPKDKNVLDAEYLYIYLSLMKDEILVPLMKGTANVSLTINSIKSASIFVPDLQTQFEIIEKINSIKNYLDDINQSILNQEKYIASFRRVILEQAIQGELISRESRGESASTLLEELKLHKEQLIKEKKVKKEKEYTPIPIEELPFEIPENWEWVRFSSIIESIRYGTSKKCDYNNDGIPVLRIPNIANSKIEHDDMKYAKLEEKEFEGLKLLPKDLLLIRSNGSTSLVGRSAVITEKEKDFCFAGYLIRVRVFTQHIDVNYVNLMLNTQLVRKQIEGPIRTTSGVKNINTTEINNLYFPLPPYDEQKRIVEKVYELMRSSDVLESNIEQTKLAIEKLMPAVLQKAFQMEDATVN